MGWGFQSGRRSSFASASRQPPQGYGGRGSFRVGRPGRVTLRLRSGQAGSPLPERRRPGARPAGHRRMPRPTERQRPRGGRGRSPSTALPSTALGVNRANRVNHAPLREGNGWRGSETPPYRTTRAGGTPFEFLRTGRRSQRETGGGRVGGTTFTAEAQRSRRTEEQQADRAHCPSTVLRVNHAPLRVGTDAGGGPGGRG